jgi:protein-tyrosine phosphatase
MNSDRKPFRVLFVCMGNICRSPAAEIVFRSRVALAGRTAQFSIDSAGTIGHHAGKAPDSRMAATLSARGYLISGKSRQIRPADLLDFDLILVMDQENLSNVRALDPAQQHRDKIRQLTDFCTSSAAHEVPDPYYGGQAGFEKVADLVEDAAQGLLDSIAS